MLSMQHTTAAKGFSAVCCMHILWWMLNYHFSHILIEQLSVNGFAAESHDFRSAAYRFCNTCKALWEGTHTNTLLPAKHLHRSSILWHALITVFPFYIWLFFFFFKSLVPQCTVKKRKSKMNVHTMSHISTRRRVWQYCINRSLFTNFVFKYGAKTIFNPFIKGIICCKYIIF